MKLWKQSRFLTINAAIAGFVFAAHGGAAMITYQQHHSSAAEIRSLALVSLPLAALVMGGSLVALIKPALQGIVLKIQSVAGALLAIYLATWGVKLLVADALPPDFMWTPGILTLFVYYVAAMSMMHLAKPTAPHGWSRSVPTVLVCCAAALDVSVLVRALS